jgi:protein SCO1
MMGKGQRIVTTVLWATTVLAMLGLLGTGLWAKKQLGNRTLAGSSPVPGSGPVTDGELPILFRAPAFALVNQNAEPVTDSTLHGSVWVAMVFFTNCPDICPGMVGRLLDLQQAVQDPRVKLVSFTLDPERDTPEALRQYAARLGADQSRWFLLSGSEDQMYEVADGLKLAAVPADGDKPITHTGRMLLVDDAGQVRGVYDSADDESMQALARDARMLSAEAAERHQ